MTETQPAPKPNDRPLVQQAVIDDFAERLQHGIREYGTGLQIGNGRDMFLDAYEESLDQTVYLKGMVMVRDEIVKILLHLLALHTTAVGTVSDDVSICNVCWLERYPCHTRVDIERILHLLGHKIENEDDATTSG